MLKAVSSSALKRLVEVNHAIRSDLTPTLPGDKSHSWYENPYNTRAYKRLCFEFGVSPDTDWRQKLDHGFQGLGSWSTFMTRSGVYRHAQVAQGQFFHPKDAMRHNCDISGAWTTFVLDKSEGFTQAAVERLNDSIRTYVWPILGAQAQTRSNILKTGTGFDAQKQFLADIEDAIASPVDIPSSNSRYQKTLQYASTPLDFVFGIGLYLSPSDMALHPGIQQRDPDSRIGRDYRTHSWDKRGRADRLQRRKGIPREDRLTSRDRSQGAAEQDERQRS